MCFMLALPQFDVHRVVDCRTLMVSLDPYDVIASTLLDPDFGMSVTPTKNLQPSISHGMSRTLRIVGDAFTPLLKLMT